MAYGVILGQTPAPPASNVSYDNSSTSGTISSTNVQGALNNVVTKTNSLQNQINTTNSNLTTNVNNLQGQINSLSSQIGSGLKKSLVFDQNYTQANRPALFAQHNIGTININSSNNLLAIQVILSGTATIQPYSTTTSTYGYGIFGLDYVTNRQINYTPILGNFPCTLAIFGDETTGGNNYPSQTYNFNSNTILFHKKIMYTRNLAGSTNYSSLIPMDILENDTSSNSAINSINNNPDILSFYLCVYDYVPGAITSFNVNLKIYVIS